MAADGFDPALNCLADALRTTLGPAAVGECRPLARHTTLRIGGPADLLAVVRTAEALRQAVALAWQHRVPCRILGSGSNVLVSDAGVRGLVVLNRARAVNLIGTQARAESGAALSAVARRCVARGLAGLEWAVGIPGTVGGAVVGNAGAWGGDIASVLTWATVLEPGGVVAEWPVERFGYGYRASVLKGQEATQRAVVLEAGFALRADDRDRVQACVSEITARRKAGQPPGASCGSVFRNPPGDYAGRLIEAAGLKGRRCGAAEISPLHANFIVNHGGATAAEVKALLDLARQTVEAHFGIRLELEIELLGEWAE